MIGVTLGRYIGWRFLNSIAGVFFTIFGLIYLVDFVETLRRAADIPQAKSLTVAFLSLLHTPAVAEQVLPFAVLFGAMAAFLNLTRKLELVIARAAGVSVWQFLTPPLGVAAAIGIVSVALFNPLSAYLHEQADVMEASMFEKSGRSATDSSLWIRQKGLDGQAIIRAEASAESGMKLFDVTIYEFDASGHFIDRVDASSAKLLWGAWKVEKARINAPGEEQRESDVYYVATNLAPQQVVQSFVAPESVPFWSLRRFTADTEGAGLDATGYRLQFQSLLARPLLLAAMILIAASFSLKFSRFGGAGPMVLGGVGAGFVLYVASKMISDLGRAGVLSAPVAAWSPAVLASMMGVLTLLNREDG